MYTPLGVGGALGRCGLPATSTPHLVAGVGGGFPPTLNPHYGDSETSYFTITYQLVSNHNNERAASRDGILTASMGTLAGLGYAVGR